MVQYHRTTLSNGLRVIIHQDHTTPLVAINVLYEVGSKDEAPTKTGFTHLFEHLMFGGTANIPNFDDVIQNAGGENNAFTNNDITNFYNILPAENLEIGLWIEADRMMGPKFNTKTLNTQKKVVVEEFKETCLNEPYGDIWHHLSPLCYGDHPYSWPTIGKDISHVETATLDDVTAFFYNYYRPNNAVLVIAGPIEIQNTLDLVIKWFGEIPSGEVIRLHQARPMPQLPSQRLSLVSDVPLPMLIMAFPMPARTEKDFYIVDLISDILGSGRSSRLYQELTKNTEICTMSDCYISGTTESGLIIIECRATKAENLPEIEALVWKELDELIDIKLGDRELQKIKNKAESNLVFSEAGVLNKAMSLAYYEYLGNIDLINDEVDHYLDISAEDIQSVSKKTFDRNVVKTMCYLPKTV